MSPARLRPELGLADPTNGLAYGVDSTRAELYSLRQARYHALAYDIQRLASQRIPQNKLKVLDIGIWRGITRHYLEAWPSIANCELYGADLKIRLTDPTGWEQIWEGDLMDGYPEIPSETFDVVVCEQVLEHLPQLEIAFHTLDRLLKPGGTLIVGVPIFPHGAHLIRRHLVPVIDRIFPPKGVRGHVQAFSRRTFERLLKQHTSLEIVETRGFRIISGGVMRPLENLYTWWRFARWVGATFPSLCIEIQVIAKKPERK